MRIDIKDRIASGDDKYIIEELEDGRVRLIPSPDSVTEEGTPLNKETLQPIADVVPERFDIDFPRGNIYNPEIRNGRTAEELYSFLRGEISVEINIWIDDNTMLRANEVRRDGDSAFTIGARVGLEQYQILVEQTQMNPPILLVQQPVKIVDYVIETGYRNGWDYRIWAFGHAECWCEEHSSKHLSWDETIGKCQKELPFEFASSPVVTCSGGQNHDDYMKSYVAKTASTTKAVIAHMQCPSAVTESDFCWYFFNVNGDIL